MRNKTLTTKEHDRRTSRVLVMLMSAMMMAFVAASGMLPVLASTNDPLPALMSTIIDIISRAALYIGIVIVLWGVFQIILAFRREDSEGISKQITTVVVGGVLIGFGGIATGLYNSLSGQGGGGKP